VGKHTPGPWFAIRNHIYWEVRTGGEQHAGQQVGDACSSLFLSDGDNGEANARVMAAAPELLAAAKTVLDGLNARIDAADGHHAPVFDGIAELHNAIAKAEGCHETFDCNAGDHSDCCPATGNSIG